MAMKKILCLLGSPRPQGNSATLARQLLGAAEVRGAETEVVELNRLAYRGCQGCYGCKTSLERCVLKDDLSPVLEAVHQADVLVLASPVYYGEVTAQLKGFVDRTFSFLKSDYLSNPHPCRLPPGKEVVMVLTQGHPDENLFADIFPRYIQFLSWYGFGRTHLLRGCGLPAQPGGKLTPELCRKAEATAALLVP